MARLGCAAEALAERSAEGCFSVAEYCEQTKTGRNFAIELLEYFDRLGFTERVGNNRQIRRPAAIVFAVDEEA
jgi:selenocysteine-specific elongation factor